ncbi:hypothetical protein M9H77_11023 [Catharanthus roseus]|uniref:Uncharacterized protein n=1 Tax=Catharanthus roseus TaxID=4058 RepID=A0ACC0BDG2_CATRO|nr:hypothetical protein M9H77_11023 [Catharanthus roseus]
MAKCSHAKELQNQCRMSVSLMRMIDLKNAQLLRVNHQLEEKDKQLKEVRASVRIESRKQENDKMRDAVEPQRTDSEQPITELERLDQENGLKNMNTVSNKDEAMQGMLNHRTTFAIKRMGQVDQKPFQTVFRNYVFKEGSGQKLL